jgi:hypothetical protein
MEVRLLWPKSGAASSASEPMGSQPCLAVVIAEVASLFGRLIQLIKGPARASQNSP